ncbi:hypothetical protein [Sporosarcina sp. ITBMC105]
MRRITVIHSDFSDGVNGWISYFEGLLINPRLVLDANDTGMAFIVLSEPMADVQKSIHVDDGEHYQVEIFRGNTVENFDIMELVHMTVWELGQFITDTK